MGPVSPFHRSMFLSKPLQPLFLLKNFWFSSHLYEFLLLWRFLFFLFFAVSCQHEKIVSSNNPSLPHKGNNESASAIVTQTTDVIHAHKCDILPSILTTNTLYSDKNNDNNNRYQNQSSKFSPHFELLKFSNLHKRLASLRNSDDPRFIRSAVIETATSPTINLASVTTTAADYLMNLIGNIAVTTQKSIIIPRVGFGDFRYPDAAHDDDLEDDEDYATVEQVGRYEEADNVASLNAAPFTASSSSVADIHSMFGDLESTHKDSYTDTREQPRQARIKSEQNDEFGSMPSGNFHSNIDDGGAEDEAADEEIPLARQSDRILIIGNATKLASLPMYSIYSMQQTLEDFEGCFCDRHYHLTTSSSSFDRDNNDNNIDKSHKSSPTNYNYDNDDDGDNSNVQRQQSSNNVDLNKHQHESNSWSGDGIMDENCQCVGESITQVPRNFSANVRKIVLKQIGLEVLQADAMQLYANLTEIYMYNMRKLHMIEAGAFEHLPHLMTIYIRMAPMLKFIPNGVFLSSIPKLMHLKVIHSGLEQLPVIYQNKSGQIISMIDFDNSRIRNLTTGSVKIRAESLNIEFNQIEFVGNHAFYESQIAKLSLKGNKKLLHLEEFAFSGLKFLRELDLSQTSITKLPTIGLSDSLEVLRIMDTFTMKEIPFIYHFKRMKEAHLTYPYHCCAFRFPANHNPTEYARLKRLFHTDRYCTGKNMTATSTRVRRSAFIMSSLSSLTWWSTYIVDLVKASFGFAIAQTQPTVSTGHKSKRQIGNSFGHFLSQNVSTDTETNDTNIYGVVHIYEQDSTTTKSYDTLEHSGSFVPNDEELIDPSFAPTARSDNELPGIFGTPHSSISPKQEFCGDISSQMPTLRCFPSPDAFNPCEDVMGNNVLRVIVWFVVVAAVLGNLAVIVVLLSGRFTFNVSKFLMINLAFADLMMGVYLSIIAVMDLRTMGVYFNFAIDWQHGIGCKITGWITVFASELSIFTLTLITLERWFAITYAIQLNRRIHLGMAIKVMLCGWLYAMTMASLPLGGISSYSKTSICLPMEHRNTFDRVYLTTLLSINCFAFVLIALCYGKMYISIISQETRANINDMAIAKRMSLLVVTDFICWAPIAFFGLTAIAGYPLIDVPHSKFVLVTFYPLNSFANPFLYVIMTKQYRRDFFILLARYGICTKKAIAYKNATRHNLNYHHHHQNHYHHRCETPRESSEITPRFLKAGAGSVFSQLSCDGQNVHLYKYICKGHHHHHYCAAHGNHYHSNNNSQHSMIGSGISHIASQANKHNVNNQNHNSACHSHFSCSGVDPASDSHGVSDVGCCPRCDSDDCGADSKSGSATSLTAAEKCKHRKHKRCHNINHQHHRHHKVNCRCQQQQQSSQQQKRACHTANCGARCCRAKCNVAAGHHLHSRDPVNGNSTSCCHSAVFSTVNIYPELSTGAERHSDPQQQQQCGDQCSCRGNNFESSSNDNAGERDGDAANRDIRNEQRNENHSREKSSTTSSDPQHHVYMLRNNNGNGSGNSGACQNANDGAINGRVLYTCNKNIAGGDIMRHSSCVAATATVAANAKFKHKRSLPFVNIIERISLATKIGRRLRAKGGKHTAGLGTGGRASDMECSETSSPYSSSTSSCVYHHHHQHQYHSHRTHRPRNIYNRRDYHHNNRNNHRCCHAPMSKIDRVTPAAVASIHSPRESSCFHNAPPEEPTNPLPIEEQREILRQALQESTSVQEAVAVVEELSSGARVSMNSSSSSKKTIAKTDE